MSKKEAFAAAATAEIQPAPKSRSRQIRETEAASVDLLPDELRFHSADLADEDKYEYDLTTGNSIDDMGDLLFDLLCGEYRETAYDIKLDLHQSAVTGRYIMSMSVDPELMGEEKMTDDEKEVARYEAEDAIEEIMMAMDEGNSGDENFESLAGFEINHRKHEFSVPSKIAMLEMIRNYARELGLKFYNIHAFHYSIVQDVEKTPQQNLRALLKEKADLLLSCKNTPGFIEGVSDCTLMRVYNSRTSHLGHAQMVLEAVGPEQMELSTRLAIIESKIYMEEPEKMGDWYKNAEYGAVRPCLN